MTEAAVIYARLSEDRDGRAAGVAEQERVCREFAERHGLDVIGVHVDNDISASSFSRKKRPGYVAVMDLVRSGAAQHIVVRETSRLYRRPRELEDLIDLCESRVVTVHAPKGGHIDLSTMAGQMMARIYAAVDAAESARISERVRGKQLALAREGKHSGGGYRPFGLTGGWDDLVPAEAEAIREAARRIIRGEGLHALAADWNRRGLRTPAAGTTRKRKDSEEIIEVSGEWSPTTLRKMLTRPYLIGKREIRSRGQVVGVYDAAWPAILDAETFAAVGVVLAENPVHPVTRTYLLTGIVWCQRCGRLMTGHAITSAANRPRVRRYACESRPGRPGCGQSIDAVAAEEWVLDQIIALADEDLRAQSKRTQAQPDVQALSERRALLEVRQRELADAYATGGMAIGLFAATGRALEAEIAEVNAALSKAAGPPVPLKMEALRSVVERGDFDARRLLVKGAVARVVVRPAIKQGRGSVAADRLSVDHRFDLVE